MIQLDDSTIERAIPRVATGLEKYCWLQDALATTDVSGDLQFQTRFNAFYRVRRNSAWRAAFYRLLERDKVERRPFADVLQALYTATGRVEASFASKLTASVDPDQPVIDTFVLKNLGLRLPHADPDAVRLARVVELHYRIRHVFATYLDSQSGRHLVARFEESYPDRRLTQVKMLDLVLWQAR